jgi:hypothetical protein
LYRAAFDYKSMVVMQFNSANLERMLGRDAEAVEAIESTIAMDREYGFREDAEDNYGVLLRLQNRPADPEHVRVLMSDFPHRSVTLQFAWSASDATLAIASSRVQLASGQLFHNESALTSRRHVRPTGRGWLVSFEPESDEYDPGLWASEPSNLPESIFSPALLQWPDFEIGDDGGFRGVVDATKFSARLSTRTEALIRERASSDEAARALTTHAQHATRIAFAPQIIDAEVTQDYALQTGMWIGATLEQGVWYELMAPLSLSGAPQTIVTHRLEFAYTHQVPCTSESTDRACVEIVVHATPDDEALAAALTNFPVPPDTLHYTSATYVRLVTDPNTLLPYLRETRRYWYLSVGDTPGNAWLESERLVSSVHYP